MKCPLRFRLLLLFAVHWTEASALEPVGEEERKRVPVSAGGEQRHRLPNVILFLVDDLGWMDLQCYGSRFHETPHVDALAAEGVRFTQAYAACHVCSPTRASVLTGKYPARLGLTDWLPGRQDHPFQKLKNAAIPPHLPLEEVTLAEALREHGYRTAHIGKWHLGEDPYGPLQQGFDQRVPAWNKGWPKAGFHAPFDLAGLEDRPGEYLTDRLTEEAERFLDANRERPFFLYLSHFAVHDPLQGRDDWVAHFEQKKARLPASEEPSFWLEGNPDDPGFPGRAEVAEWLSRPAWSGYQLLPQRTVKIKQQQDNPVFAAMVASMDESLGRIRAKLDALGLTENTILVFFSDNGGMSAANFGRPGRVIAHDQLDAAFATSNRPLRGAKGWLYEGGLRVPLILLAPGLTRPGSVCEVPVISNDLYPTLLELAGLPLRPEQHCDGVSLVPLLQEAGGRLSRSALFWHFPHYSNHGQQSPGAAIRVGDEKLIEYFENGGVQLFDLKQDSAEAQDLAAMRPERVADLRTQLHAWQATVGARQMEPNPGFQASMPWR